MISVARPPPAAWPRFPIPPLASGPAISSDISATSATTPPESRPTPSLRDMTVTENHTRTAPAAQDSLAQGECGGCPPVQLVRYRWQFGHQNRSRSWPGGPCSPRLIGVPQRRQGRPARPYTQLSRPGLVSPVVTWPGRALLASSSRCPSSTRASGSSTEPTGRHEMACRQVSQGQGGRVNRQSEIVPNIRVSPHRLPAAQDHGCGVGQERVEA
jgi:hypothetical protein